MYESAVFTKDCPPPYSFLSSLPVPPPRVGPWWVQLFGAPLHLLLFWLQRAISCAERRAGWEGAGAEVSVVVLALSLPSGSILPHFLSVFLFPLLSCVSYASCSSRLLTFLLFGVFFFFLLLSHSTSDSLLSGTHLASRYHPVTRYFPLTSNKRLLFFPPTGAGVAVLIAVAEQKLLPDEMWLTC